MAPNITEASTGLDSSGRALTRPKQSNTTRPNVYTELRGQVHAPEANDEASKRHIITTAERFERRVATPGEITLAFFTSASCQREPDRETVGAYSVVFTEMLPKTDDHGKQAEMAWSSRLLRKKGAAEALAVVQALQVAHQRLRTLPPDSGGPKLATVQIFTRDLYVLHEMALNHNTWSARRSPTPHVELLRSIQFMMFEHAQKLGEIAHLEVDLHLYWLTGKSGIESQRAAKRIALKSLLHDGEHMFTLDGEARPAAEMPPPVYLDVEHALAEKIKDRKKKDKKSAAARIPVTSRVGYQDTWYAQSYDPCPEPYVSSFSDPEDYCDSDLEVYGSVEPSPEPSHPSHPEPYSSEPPPMGGDPDMVSDIPFPGTNKPMWWRDLGPARPTVTSETEEVLLVNSTEATVEEEDDLLEEHVLEQCIRFMGERRMRGHRDEPVLEFYQEVYLKELRRMAPENPLVRAHEAKQARINRLEEEILSLRKLANEKEKELRNLARDHPPWFRAFSP